MLYAKKKKKNRRVRCFHHRGKRFLEGSLIALTKIMNKLSLKSHSNYFMLKMLEEKKKLKKNFALELNLKGSIITLIRLMVNYLFGFFVAIGFVIYKEDV